MINPKFIAVAEKEDLVFSDDEKYREYLRTLEGIKLEVVIKKWSEKSQRSIQQLRYYWGVVLKLISDHTGHSPDELHEIFKVMFHSKLIELETKEGKIIQKIGKSTTELTTVSMEDYLFNIRQWGSLELGLNIPEPNQVDYES